MRRRREAWAGLLFVLPSLAGVAVFLLLPFLDVTLRSFQGAVVRQWKGMDNYLSVFRTPAFRLAAVNTLRFTGICIPILLVLSLLTGVLLQRQKACRNLLKSVFLLPMAIPVASVVLVWRVLFHENGMLNRLCQWAGGNGADFMDSGWAFWVLVISYLWKNLGYDIVLWTAGLSAIPASICEAAAVDGAGDMTCFFKIILPNLRPVLYTVTVLSFLNSFKVFREAYLAAGDYPHKSMYLLQHLFGNWFREMDLDKLSAGAVLMTAVIFIAVCFLQKAWEYEE